MRDQFQIWVDAVCEQVRFQPDRRAIARELRVHYEDHMKDLLRLGRDPALAEERALDAMGNAQEVGRALDRVHKPWLGWLWEASRVLLLLLAVLAVAAPREYTSLSTLKSRTQAELDWEAPPASAARVELEHGTLYVLPGEVREQNGYTAAEVHLWIQMRDPLAANGGVETWFFSWRDGQGDLPRRTYDEWTRTWTEGRCWDYEPPWSQGWTRFRQTMVLLLDQPPQWAELSYPPSGDWTVRGEWVAAS